jgi:hypothetical protein
MTELAQQNMIFGAICMDPVLREALFELPCPRTKVAGLIHGYAETNGVSIDESVVDNVWNVFKDESPCRNAARHWFALAKATACPCWPC